MRRLNSIFVLVGFAVLLWAYCGGLIALGRSFMSMDATLVLHAIGAPIGAAVSAWLYHRWFGQYGPLVTASAFLGVALFLDVFVVALLIEGSFQMFASPIGTWIPLALIFGTALWIGRISR